MFFGGLHWTVRKAVTAKQPALWFFGSLVLRMSATTAGFYAVSGPHWERLLLCVLGFFVARAVVLRWTKSAPKAQISAMQDASHAP